MFTYKLTLCKRHSEKQDRSMFNELDQFYSVDFDTPHALVDNLLRSEALLLENDLCALVTRHYREKDRMLVVLEKGYHKGYGIFFLNEKGFHEVKNKFTAGGGASASGFNSKSSKRLQITLADCTAWYVDAREVSDERKMIIESELNAIEKEHGVPKFDSEVVNRWSRGDNSWKSFISHTFSTEKSPAPLYVEEPNVYDAFNSKNIRQEQVDPQTLNDFI